MFHGDFLYLDIVLAAAMLLLLAMGAYSDAHGAEVPDTITVPYAIFGISTSFLHGRLMASAISVLLLVIILSGWTPKCMKRLNAKLMARSYSGEEELQAETDTLEQVAGAFAAKHSRWMDKACTGVILVGIAASAGVSALGGFRKEELLFLAALIGLFIPYAYLRAKAKEAGEGSMELESEELSAFGGADTIVMAGLLGFYGGIPFVYGMAATMVVIFLLSLVARHGGRKGIPLLPGILLMAPVRIFILVTYCPRLIQAFSWAARNIFPWLGS